jgi:Holliday junction resolvasome RuvABC endonuclease subunit
MIIAGIDYSMISPAISIYDDSKPFHVDNVKIYYYTSIKRCIVNGPIFYGTHYKDGSWDSNEERFLKIALWAMGCIRENKVTDAFIEGYSYGSKGPVFHIGENTGYLKSMLWSDGISIGTIAPTDVKKSFSGKGTARKNEMEAQFVEETGINVRSVLNMSEKAENPSSDVVDSYAVLKSGLKRLKIIPQ